MFTFVLIWLVFWTVVFYCITEPGPERTRQNWAMTVTVHGLLVVLFCIAWLYYELKWCWSCYKENKGKNT